MKYVVAGLVLIAACGGKAVVDGGGSGGASVATTNNVTVTSTGTGTAPSDCQDLCDRLEQNCNPVDCLARCAAASPGCEAQKKAAVSCALDHLQPTSCNVDGGCKPTDDSLAVCELGDWHGENCHYGGSALCTCNNHYGGDKLVIECKQDAVGIECTCIHNDSKNDQVLGTCRHDGDPDLACSFEHGSCCTAIFAAEL